ncbi:hypothetical protein [Mycobacterium sp. 1245852.3]|uniref:hypothetical protein n=1 Tax=Mycobacterium sp. 1245852.3 TaxID=1856860 RepID=UPI0007FD21E3|nr:hypothetical protein [Mycobacterium sp. 1245852.3]OBJ86971.1 hypothetical protein A9W96_02350 [Mycobacterium sp. 1245852.3]
MTAADLDWRDFSTFGDERVAPAEPDPDNRVVFHPQVGDTVKPMWPLGEAMWVAVESVDERGQLSGTLANAPIAIPLNYGDRIWFHTSDIVQQTSAPAAGAA